MPAAPRFPAEWEPQAGTLLAWPHEGTDWAPRLPDADSAYAGMAAAIADRQPLLVLVRDSSHRDHVATCLEQHGAAAGQVGFAVVPCDDTWIRDFGPLSVERDGRPGLLDFRFDGWGGKFDAARDDAAAARLDELGCFGGTPMTSVDFVLEGGAVDSDGAGGLLTTRQCWRSRHPELTTGQLEERFRNWFGASHCLWLEHGELDGDDTDAHVDTLARFLSPGVITYQACDDPGDPHHEPLSAMAEELAAMRTAAGQPYELAPLPWPGDLRDDQGRRLPASYANFLFVNGALLVPTYGVDADAEALAKLSSALPDRRVLPVPSRTLIWQNGSLHCATMQIARGVGLKGAG